jgi:coenzyme PQQ synthesis protein D (PqqD)
MIARHGNWVSGKVGEELVIMNTETGSYMALNEVGTRVWEMLETPRHLDEVCTLLEKEFEVPPDVCRAEVKQFLNELAGHGAVNLEPVSTQIGGIQ